MRVRTFGQLIEDTLLQMGFADETGRQRDIVKAAVRRSASERAVQEDYPFMRMPRPSTIQVVAGQRVYAVNPLFRAPIYFRLRSTGQPLVEAKSDMGIEQGLPLESATGTPLRYELRGQTNVRKQPATAGVITVTNAAGDDGKTVTIQGEDADGYWVEETVELASGTGVTANSFSLVLWVRKDGSDDWDGAITVTADAGATQLVVIPAGDQGTMYRLLYLWTAPSTADVIEYDFWRLPNDLSNDNDIPSVPPPFSDIHVYDALVETAGFSRATPTEVQHWNDRRMEIKHSLSSSYLEGQANNADASYMHLVPR